MGALVPLVGWAAGVLAVLLPADLPVGWPPMSALAPAVALGVAGALCAHAGLLAWIILTASALVRDGSPEPVLVGGTMTFLLAVLIPTAVRNVAPALPGPRWTRLVSTPFLTFWLLLAWVQALPLGRSVAVFGNAEGTVATPAVDWLWLYVSVAVVATGRAALELRYPSPGAVSAAAAEAPALVALRALVGAALLVLPWTPLLREAPLLLGLCLVLAIVLRLVRVGILPSLVPAPLRRYVIAQPGLSWLSLGLVGFALCSLLTNLSSTGPVVVGASIAIGLALATLVEVAPAPAASRGIDLAPEPAL